MPKIPYTKQFFSYQEQISLLKSRGMQFSDENKALHLLEYVSYYRFSGYWYPLLADKQTHIFNPGSTFETVFDLYKFDKELRKLISVELEKIEISVRSKMAYILSIAYGSFWIEDGSLFIDSYKHQSTLKKVGEEFKRSDEAFVVSFKSKYSNPVPPSFITLEITSFGTLSRLYENLKSGKTKREISKAFGLSDVIFMSWLHSLVYIRNMCAHHVRLWNRQMRIRPLFPKNSFNNWLANQQVDNTKIYYVLSMIVYLLNIINPNHSFKQKIEDMFLKYPNVDRLAMGFPISYKSEALWGGAYE